MCRRCHTQRKTLAELEANPAIADHLDDAEKATIRKIIAGDVVLGDVDEAMRKELNEAMSIQRVCSKRDERFFSHHVVTWTRLLCRTKRRRFNQPHRVISKYIGFAGNDRILP